MWKKVEKQEKPQEDKNTRKVEKERVESVEVEDKTKVKKVENVKSVDSVENVTNDKNISRGENIDKKNIVETSFRIFTSDKENKKQDLKQDLKQELTQDKMNIKVRVKDIKTQFMTRNLKLKSTEDKNTYKTLYKNPQDKKRKVFPVELDRKDKISKNEKILKELARTDKTRKNEKRRATDIQQGDLRDYFHQKPAICSMQTEGDRAGVVRGLPGQPHGVQGGGPKDGRVVTLATSSQLGGAESVCKSVKSKDEAVWRISGGKNLS